MGLEVAIFISFFALKSNRRVAWQRSDRSIRSALRPFATALRQSAHLPNSTCIGDNIPGFWVFSDVAGKFIKSSSPSGQNFAERFANWLVSTTVSNLFTVQVYTNDALRAGESERILTSVLVLLLLVARSSFVEIPSGWERANVRSTFLPSTYLSKKSIIAVCETMVGNQLSCGPKPVMTYISVELASGKLAFH